MLKRLAQTLQSKLFCRKDGILTSSKDTWGRMFSVREDVFLQTFAMFSLNTMKHPMGQTHETNHLFMGLALSYHICKYLNDGLALA